MPVIPATQEAKAGGLQVQGQTELHSKFKASLANLVKLRIKMKREKRSEDVFQW